MGGGIGSQPPSYTSQVEALKALQQMTDTHDKKLVRVDNKDTGKTTFEIVGIKDKNLTTAHQRVTDAFVPIDADVAKIFDGASYAADGKKSGKVVKEEKMEGVADKAVGDAIHNIEEAEWQAKLAKLNARNDGAVYR